VLACPFGVPRYVARIDQMMKCDMCYDRTSAGKRPMCVTVCPSGALHFGPRGEIEALRRERPSNRIRIGSQEVRTKVRLMLPAGADVLEMDVAERVSAGGGHERESGVEGRLPDLVGR
jgi:Fe-S-cluster-containing dehydrogenase component